MLLRSVSAPILKSCVIDPSPEPIIRTISASISISLNHDPIIKKISTTVSDRNFNELYKIKIKPFPKGGYSQFASNCSQNQETVTSSLSFGVSTSMSLVSEMERLDQECAVLENGGGGGRICGGGDGSDHGFESIEDYYQEMIKVDPNNLLFLGNYAKFLKEVKGDVVKAEEYCGRAIVANANDGDIFSLYGDLVWDAHKDADRADCYYNQAVKASPDDCYVLASYARFLWDAGTDDDDDDDEEEEDVDKATYIMNTSSVNFLKGVDSFPSPPITAS
ncbi:uncharacterized protein LOC132029519 isoform X1 [Lycium ferocissimum]|uniref:uncharacterized protein LOC132029519 isoform X1 n=1 Tax=Lycium ferocissimum TaxID=112874 RepID=UPI0028151C54|nr:uncharacterized protein LOC132029519 isoform X1 [Lycium ferocissimum]